jgi:hypothetical protein
MNVLDKPKTIFVLEHQNDHRLFIEKKLSKFFPDHKIHTEDHQYHIFMTMARERPDILVTDWNFQYESLIQNDHVFARLLHFKGLVIIFTGQEVRDVKNQIIDKIKHIPENFRIISKYAPNELVKEIKSFEYRKAENFPYPACDDSID